MGRLLAVGATPSCGASQHAAPPVASPACHFRGAWTDREIGGAIDRRPFAYVVDGFAEGVLRQEPGGPTLHLRAASRGWILVGTGDLRSGRSLLALRRVDLAAGVTAHAGAAVTVEDARPGEALVGADPSVFGNGVRVRFRVDPARWTPCGALGFDAGARSTDANLGNGFDEAMADRAEDGLAIVAPAVVDLAATPGGAPFAHIDPGEGPLVVSRHAAEGRFARVTLRSPARFSLRAWLPSAVLGGAPVPVPDRPWWSVRRTSRPAPAARRALTVCRSEVALPFRAARPDRRSEDAGYVSAGIEFVRGPPEPDGGFEIASYAPDGSPHPTADVRWIARPAAPIACRDVIE